MFCVYCGEKCPDLAKFCPNCGKKLLKPEDIERLSEKEQCVIDDNKGGQKQFAFSTSYNLKIKPIAFAASIISLIIEAIIILLSFTDIFKIVIGSGYYSSSIEIGIFDLFDLGNTIPRIVYNSEDFSSLLLFHAVLCIICLAICIIYFLYNLFSYSFNDNSRRCIWGKNYSHYSSVPAIIFICASLFGILLFSDASNGYVSAEPNAPLIGIYVLTGIQFVTNIMYDYSY